MSIKNQQKIFEILVRFDRGEDRQFVRTRQEHQLERRRLRL